MYAEKFLKNFIYKDTIYIYFLTNCFKHKVNLLLNFFIIQLVNV
jgi:hypothetical protein